jgi:hypothetical protein
MGLISNGKVTIIGNFEKPKRYKHGRPKDAFDRDYKAIIPYDFEWRATLGKVTCDCTECIEAYQPYYGFTWYHMPECAILKHYNKHPQMANLGIYYPDVIAMSE